MGGDGTLGGSALHRLRARWLAPSPPLAVDDEPHWTPPEDPADETAGGDGEPARPAAPSGSTP
jgi:hypothetical protein